MARPRQPARTRLPVAAEALTAIHARLCALAEAEQPYPPPLLVRVDGGRRPRSTCSWMRLGRPCGAT